MAVDGGMAGRAVTGARSGVHGQGAGAGGRGAVPVPLLAQPSAPRGAVGQSGRDGRPGGGRDWYIGFWRAVLARAGCALWYKGFWLAVCVRRLVWDRVRSEARVSRVCGHRGGRAGGRKWCKGFCHAGVGRGGRALWYKGFWSSILVRASGRNGVGGETRVPRGRGRRGGAAGGRKWYIGFCQASVARGGGALWYMEFWQKRSEEGLRRRAARAGALRPGARRTGAGGRGGGRGGSVGGGCLLAGGGLLGGGARGLAGGGDRLPPGGAGGGDGAAAHAVRGSGDATGGEVRRHQLGRIIVQAGDEGGGQEVPGAAGSDLDAVAAQQGDAIAVHGAGRGAVVAVDGAGGADVGRGPAPAGAGSPPCAGRWSGRRADGSAACRGARGPGRRSRHGCGRPAGQAPGRKAHRGQAARGRGGGWVCREVLLWAAGGWERSGAATVAAGEWGDIMRVPDQGQKRHK